MSADAQADTGADQLLSQIVQDHGGRERFDATALAVAARLAAILSSDSDGSAAQIAQLVELLPPKPSATEPAWDLTKLTDKELDQLDRISRKATGLEPPTPEKPRRGPPHRSYREVWAESYAVAVDGIEAELENARRDKRPRALTDGDLSVLHNACQLWFGDMVTAKQVFAHVVENAVYAVRREYADREAAELAARAAAEVPIAPTGEREANVVRAVPFGAPRERPPYIGGDRPL
jgi:hypothetical protein